MIFRVMREGARSSPAAHATVRARRWRGDGLLAIGRMASPTAMPGIPSPPRRLTGAVRVSRRKGVGSTDDIVDLVDKHNIDQIVAILSSTPGAQAHLRRMHEDRLQAAHLPTGMSCRSTIGDVRLRDVDGSIFRPRGDHPNTRAVSGYIAGETVLVTGGGGSIGSELCRQLCKVAPARIVIFDMYENDAYMLRNELLAEYDDIDLVIEIGNVCDEARLNEVFSKYRPGAVFHAAAHKHVPLMEQCPRERCTKRVRDAQRGACHDAALRASSSSPPIRP
ncbi:MAG: polysaccharide biosynthesis protein [Eggerthella lenta]